MMNDYKIYLKRYACEFLSAFFMQIYYQKIAVFIYNSQNRDNIMTFYI